MNISIGILTVSDRSSRGERPDASGPRLARLAEAQGWRVAEARVVPDDVPAIQQVLKDWCDAKGLSLVVTTGGTGPAPRDVTPEATRPLLDKELPGLSESLRREGLKQTPLAVLSRGLAGLRRGSLIVNLPGSPAGAEDGLRALIPLVPHVVTLAAGEDPHLEKEKHAHA